jgi:hypothetical protein
MEQSPSWEASNHSASEKNPLPFMDPKGSLLCSQEIANGPSPEPTVFSLLLQEYL